MTARGGLLLRGMRWRLGASVLTVVTAAIAVGAAVLGPLYLNTAGDSVLRGIVASAPVQDSGVTVYTRSDQTNQLGAVRRAERIVQGSGGARPLYGAAITTVTSGVILSNRDKSQLFWGPGSAIACTSSRVTATSAPAMS